jgi:hypothetical protein
MLVSNDLLEFPCSQGSVLVFLACTNNLRGTLAKLKPPVLKITRIWAGVLFNGPEQLTARHEKRTGNGADRRIADTLAKFQSLFQRPTRKAAAGALFFAGLFAMGSANSAPEPYHWEDKTCAEADGSTITMRATLGAGCYWGTGTLHMIPSPVNNSLTGCIKYVRKGCPRAA